MIDVETEDPKARVAEFTNGAMADVVMDVAAIATSTIPLAVMLTRSYGRVLLAGLKHFAPVENFISDLVVFKQLTLVGGAGYTPAPHGLTRSGVHTSPHGSSRDARTD